VTLHAANFVTQGVPTPQVNIVSELCTDGTLFDLLVKYGGGTKGLSEAQTVHIIKDVCRGLLHMHS